MLSPINLLNWTLTALQLRMLWMWTEFQRTVDSAQSRENTQVRRGGDYLNNIFFMLRRVLFFFFLTVSRLEKGLPHMSTNVFIHFFSFTAAWNHLVVKYVENFSDRKVTHVCIEPVRGVKITTRNHWDKMLTFDLRRVLQDI